MRVTLKLATSLDGRIATASGESRWITGDAARQEAHRLRAIHAAVLVGVETVIADDPELTVRLAGYVGGQPTRVVLDSRLRIPPDAKLVAGARRVPTIVISTRNSNKRLTDAGVRLIQVPDSEGRVDVLAATLALKETGVSSVMIEGGGQVAASFLSRGLVDAVEWFRAPIVLGDEGRPAVGAFVLKDLAAAPRFHRTEVQTLGDDLWERYEKA
ncbi:MAG TPA: bifunctional diaminohydroxyphosphoribosylaminopyrimidine deaminase/5-amino-6-(5-phosphoribosylamino)uracil reductase RibD [Caulobacteraceae bacterium]|jgi:diaminohydroxyphosphoribosylaminopyrimidine deaminase/5-amino-6-(5-phosphoribosylamino)uracil reductase